MHYFKLCKSFIILFITYLHTCVEELNFQIIPHSGTRIDQTLHSKLRLKCIGVNLHYFRKKQAMSLSLFVAKEIVLTIFFRLYFYSRVRINTILTLSYSHNVELWLYGKDTLFESENNSINVHV